MMVDRFLLVCVLYGALNDDDDNYRPSSWLWGMQVFFLILSVCVCVCVWMGWYERENE